MKYFQENSDELKTKGEFRGKKIKNVEDTRQTRSDCTEDTYV